LAEVHTSHGRCLSGLCTFAPRQNGALGFQLLADQRDGAIADARCLGDLAVAGRPPQAQQGFSDARRFRSPRRGGWAWNSLTNAWAVGSVRLGESTSLPDAGS
jgi:hypothetical protein